MTLPNHHFILGPQGSDVKEREEVYNSGSLPGLCTPHNLPWTCFWWGTQWSFLAEAIDTMTETNEKHMVHTQGRGVCNPQLIKITFLAVLNNICVI